MGDPGSSPVSADSSVSWSKTLSPTDIVREGTGVLCRHVPGAALATRFLHGGTGQG